MSAFYSQILNVNIKELTFWYSF